MSFPKYPEYKDSGVEWLGEVPAHWVVGPLRWYATIQGGVAKGKNYSDDTPTIDLPYLRVANVQDGHVDLSSVNTVTVALSEVDRYRLQPGDVLMNEGGDNDKLGRGTVWEGEIADCLHQNHVFAIRPNQHLLPYWLSMFTRSSAARSYFYLYSKQSTNLASISSSNVMSCPLPLPPQEEQRQFLSFLEHETTRIDASVKQQKRLVELLKEKRQAVISHAVTKGLDPDVPMKDSGVEWLGEVPAHWEVVPLGLLARQIQTGPFGSQLHSHEYVEGGVPVINPSNIVDGEILPDPSSTVTQEVVERLANQRLSEGEIVVGRRGEMGRCAVVSSEESGWVCGTGSMKISLIDRADSDFVSMFIRTPLVRGLLQIESVGSTMDNLNPEILSRVRVPVPPIEEQRDLIEKVRLIERKTQRLISEALQGSEFLQERRSALISAAVTGKIDVRGWQPPAGSPAHKTTQTEMV